MTDEISQPILEHFAQPQPHGDETSTYRMLVCGGNPPYIHQPFMLMGKPFKSRTKYKWIDERVWATFKSFIYQRIRKSVIKRILKLKGFHK